jgi:alpha-galactosidase
MFQKVKIFFTLLLASGLTVSGGEPPNEPACLQLEADAFMLAYNGAMLLSASVSGEFIVSTTETLGDQVEQRFVVSREDGLPVSLKMTVMGSDQAMAAETFGAAQKRFPLVRTSHGPSLNNRNNAVYDRFSDWMIEISGGVTRIKPTACVQDATYFEIMSEGPRVEIIFRPRYYQRHKNIRYFEPWNYTIRKESITGWCSWWAYQNDFKQEHLERLLEVWWQKHLGDYGYSFIQIDDGFQGALDVGRRNAPTHNGYRGGRPETWLSWRPDRFPTGMTGYVASVRSEGLIPGVWIGCFFSDEETVEAKPEWFVRGPDNKPFAGPYVSYAMDATVPEVANRLIRPTYRGLHQAGFRYVKIDQLRHLLYDNLHHNTAYARAHGTKPAEIFRAYLSAAREELGEETFLLACWGVLPEAVGLADGCRIGGDGYGPVTLQQYNSWNGIVWRNDPDHCDILPRRKPAEEGNVRKTDAVTASHNDTIIRPALASIAGGLLMLSDKPEVYADERNLLGIRRASPVLFSVPGQLYDFDPAKTEVLQKGMREEITNGSKKAPTDGDQHGVVSPWWLNEFNLGFTNWNVLHHLNWASDAIPAQRVSFQDLGLEPDQEYLVFEFWTDRFLGSFKTSFEVPPLGPMGLHSFALRPKTSRPQLLSTNRHLSQGAADLDIVVWEDAFTLTGKSRVVDGDRYVLTLHLPEGFAIKSASFGDTAAEVACTGEIARIAFLPSETGTDNWRILFQSK